MEGPPVSDLLSRQPASRPGSPTNAGGTPAPLARLFALGYRATPTTLAVGAQALSRIWYPWRELLPGWSLRFLGGRDQFLGRTLWPDRVIEVYVRAGQSLDEVAFALAHEVGHAVDLEHLDPGARARWRQARQLPTALAWFGASDAKDFDTPAGDWAECFAYWQIGAVGFQSELGVTPDEATLALLAELALDAEKAPSAGGVTERQAQVVSLGQSEQGPNPHFVAEGRPLSDRYIS